MCNTMGIEYRNRVGCRRQHARRRAARRRPVRGRLRLKPTLVGLLKEGERVNRGLEVETRRPPRFAHAWTSWAQHFVGTAAAAAGPSPGCRHHSRCRRRVCFHGPASTNRSPGGGNSAPVVLRCSDCSRDGRAGQQGRRARSSSHIGQFRACMCERKRQGNKHDEIQYKKTKQYTT
jgi:hypothetical protein